MARRRTVPPQLRILVDTTVWRDFFTGVASEEKLSLNLLLRNRYHVVLTPTILMELLQGTQADARYHQIREYLLQIPVLPLSTETHVEAAEINRRLRRMGLRLQAPQKCLAAAAAMEHDCVLLHRDTDLDCIIQHTPIRAF